MIKVECVCCDRELDEPGALIFGAPHYSGDPDSAPEVVKMHVCVRCYGPLLDRIGSQERNNPR